MLLRSSLLCLVMLSFTATGCDMLSGDKSKKSAKDDDDDDDKPKKKKKKKDDDDTKASASSSAGEVKTDATASGDPTAASTATGTATATGTTTSGTMAPAGCEAYFKALDCMVTKVPAQSQQQMKDGFEQAKSSMKQIPADMAANVCKQALDGMQESLKTMGCATGGTESTPPMTGTPPPPPPPVATSTTPGGKSAVPTAEEWAAQTKEIGVLNSTKLNCESKQVREWIRVSCKGKNDTGGTPTAVSVTKGGGRGDDFTFASNGVASLVYRWYEGQLLEADFKWTDKTKTLVVAWPRGAPEPPVRGIFK
ncbi:MAG: DUF5339 domain-containing protein [Polyangiaceae bacterium]|nr:DUF5339 domain-containing protein [Polyangiaceae bacterium]